ncbi:hypothetical protein SAMN05216297_110181 [Flavobacterium phragmitis]|uniref:Uncharacterized protein n=1 Tax=Flavobacterium phragmitis TaxID=739143 RepID=A0A1I1U4D9_9FLAO|nr:hypothetical protein SAMN05216297_110181 [Flavobacterium phragmitis]
MHLTVYLDGIVVVYNYIKMFSFMSSILNDLFQVFKILCNFF